MIILIFTAYHFLFNNRKIKMCCLIYMFILFALNVIEISLFFSERQLD